MLIIYFLSEWSTFDKTEISNYFCNTFSTNYDNAGDIIMYYFYNVSILECQVAV